MNSEQRDALRASIDSMLTDCIHQTGALSGGDLELPVLGDWVLVAVVDDAANPYKGGAITIQPKSQWRYRTIGLLTQAADDYRSITKDDD